MVVNNPNNWHWVDKNVLPWSKSYITEKLTDLKFEDDADIPVTIVSVTVTGDSDLSQRKSKAIVIYDMHIKFQVRAAKKGEEEDKEHYKTDVELLEFIHDMDADDYQFNIIEKALEDSQKQYLRQAVFPKVIAVLSKYQDDVISEHAGDLMHFSK